MKPPSAEPPIHYEGHTPGVERVASVTHPIKPKVAEIARPVQLKIRNSPLNERLATANLLVAHSHIGFRAYQTQVMPRQSF